MAKIETLVTNPNLPSDHAIKFINIGTSVGLNGVNRSRTRSFPQFQMPS
jgi:hypothetical protein